MLTEEERTEIEAHLKHYDFKRGASIEALKILQRRRGGWVSDEGLNDLAPLLEMTPAELDNVATFYNLIYRKPVGKHVILLCNSVSCWVMGYENVRDRLSERLKIDFGGTTTDGNFTLIPMVCLGTCDHAPAMMVDDQLFQDLSPERIDQILAGYQEE